ncbi:MAG: DUF6788 family protein [Acidimicrobiales bacterium]
MSSAGTWASRAEIDRPLPGTVTVRTGPCGKPTCRCHADPPQLHGPPTSPGPARATARP